MKLYVGDSVNKAIKHKPVDVRGVKQLLMLQRCYKFVLTEEEASAAKQSDKALKEKVSAALDTNGMTPEEILAWSRELHQNAIRSMKINPETSAEFEKASAVLRGRAVAANKKKNKIKVK